MKDVQGSIGTCVSLAFRIGQTILSLSSLLFMSLGVGFYSFTAFCATAGQDPPISPVFQQRTASQQQLQLQSVGFLVTVMGLAIPWSFTLALLDGYLILAKCPIQQSRVLLVVILGDLVLSMLMLAAASSTASIVDLLLKAGASFCPPRLCIRYQISSATAFLSWILSLISCLSNLWLLPSL